MSSPTGPPEPQCTQITSTVAETRGDTVVTSTGLRYLELQAGTGAPVVSCQWVLAHIEGSLVDGTVFEDTRAGGQPAEFLPGVHPLIDGFAEGLIGMQAGGTRLLIIPPNLGFGDQPRTDQQGNVIVPANSTLHFEVDLLEIDN